MLIYRSVVHGSSLVIVQSIVHLIRCLELKRTKFKKSLTRFKFEKNLMDCAPQGLAILNKSVRRIHEKIMQDLATLLVSRTMGQGSRKRKLFGTRPF